MPRKHSLKKKLTLLLASSLFACGLGLAGLKLYEVYRGANIANLQLHHPIPVMWMQDDECGYRNRPGVDRLAFGKIIGRTNSRGFRDTREFTERKGNDVFRVMGVGDSVMFGIRVDLEDTFLGLLQSSLKRPESRVEVINCAVVGHSVYQHSRYLEKMVLPLDPDLVLVNFCDNDWLATENPFDNGRELALANLDRLLADDSRRWTEYERQGITELMGIMRDKSLVWPSILEWVGHPNHWSRRYPLVKEILLEIPILRMSELIRSRGSRLLYVFIPGTIPDEIALKVAEDLRAFMVRHGIEFLDLHAALEDSGTHSVIATSPWNEDPSSFLAPLLPEGWDPGLMLDNIGRWNQAQHLHENRNFIDAAGHLSRKGHRIVAEKIREYLAEHP